MQVVCPAQGLQSKNICCETGIARGQTNSPEFHPSTRRTQTHVRSPTQYALFHPKVSHARHHDTMHNTRLDSGTLA